jgi:hypothetical protein
MIYGFFTSLCSDGSHEHTSMAPVAGKSGQFTQVKDPQQPFTKSTISGEVFYGYTGRFCSQFKLKFSQWTPRLTAAPPYLKRIALVDMVVISTVAATICRVAIRSHQPKVLDLVCSPNKTRTRAPTHHGDYRRLVVGECAKQIQL